MIASVVQSSRYLDITWDALTDEAKKQIITDWAKLIESDPEQAANLIICDIAMRPGLAEAWSKLSSEGAQLGRHNCFTYLVTLVTEAEPSAV